MTCKLQTQPWRGDQKVQTQNRLTVTVQGNNVNGCTILHVGLQKVKNQQVTCFFFC